MLSGIEAVAFDLDGTLYPNRSLYLRLLPFILKHGRLVLSFARARDRIRAEQEKSGFVPYADFYAYQARIAAGMLGADSCVIQEKIDRLIYRGWEVHFKKIKLFPHAAETLAVLRRAGLRLALLSDFPPEVKLEYLGIDHIWDAVSCSERTGTLKPHSRSFLDMAGALGLSPEKICYVGNSRRYDVRGAKLAGMKAALIGGCSRAEASRHGLTAPDFVFNDYRQLLDFVLR
jgi:putative hydrolase of the HAD superfamily